MRIVWILNGILPEAAEALNIRSTIRISWVEAICPLIGLENNLIIAGPVSGVRQLLRQEKERVIYYGVPTGNALSYDKKMKQFFCELFRREQPDLIHIWGTEFPHALSAVEAAEELDMTDRIAVSVQGLVSFIAKHYTDGVPNRIKYLMVPKNFVRGYNLYLTQKAFEKRGRYEASLLSRVKHVIGRTDWDRACTGYINPERIYHKNSESMRPIFYSAAWKREKSVTHRIFLSQGNSPLKGTHRVLEALEMLKDQYPDVKLCLTGRDITGRLSIGHALRMDPYEWYLRGLIRRKKLQDHVIFLGTLSAEQMCEQYLQAQVFVLSSSIENSPNALGEAMLLGTPCVVADVGGVRSMADSDEVFFYPHDEPYMLAYYIEKAFAFDEEVSVASAKASEHAKQTHDVDQNMQELLKIYTGIMNRESEV